MKRKACGVAFGLGAVFVLAGCPERKPLTRPPASATGPAPRAPTRDAAALPPGPARLTAEQICAAPVVTRVAALPGKTPFDGPSVDCGPDGGMCATVPRSPDPKDLCFVANDNISRAERDARGTPARPRVLAPASSSTSSPPPASPPVVAGGAPRGLDRVDAKLHLTSEEHAKLAQNRFVVLDRYAYTDYASAFHEVFQEELPLYVGVDPIFHAVYRGTELALERIERKRLVPALASMLKKLRAALPAAAVPAETRADLDLYLGVAQALAAGNGTRGRLSALKGGDDGAIADLVSRADARALESVSIFGRDRMIDFSQLEPRGHYTASAAAYGGTSLDAYFQSVMWLSRLELNLVSRSSRSSSPAIDPRETPREVALALALADLVERSGASAELRAFEEVYGAFAGKREDVSVPELARIARASGIRPGDPDAADRLRSAASGSPGRIPLARAMRASSGTETSSRLPANAP